MTLTVAVKTTESRRFFQSIYEAINQTREATTKFEKRNSDVSSLSLTN